MKKSFLQYLLSDDKDLVFAAMVCFFVAGVVAAIWGNAILVIMCFTTVKVISFLAYLSWRKSNKQINK